MDFVSLIFLTLKIAICLGLIAIEAIIFLLLVINAIVMIGERYGK